MFTRCMYNAVHFLFLYTFIYCRGTNHHPHHQPHHQPQHQYQAPYPGDQQQQASAPATMYGQYRSYTEAMAVLEGPATDHSLDHALDVATTDRYYADEGSQGSQRHAGIVSPYAKIPPIADARSKTDKVFCLLKFLYFFFAKICLSNTVESRLSMTRFSSKLHYARSIHDSQKMHHAVV
jgi:hypothetical protein